MIAKAGLTVLALWGLWWLPGCANEVAGPATTPDTRALLLEACVEGNIDALIELERLLGRKETSRRVAKFPFRLKPVADPRDMPVPIQPPAGGSPYLCWLTMVADEEGTAHIIALDSTTFASEKQPGKQLPSHSLFYYVKMVRGWCAARNRIPLGQTLRSTNRSRLVRGKDGTLYFFILRTMDSWECKILPGDPKAYESGHYELLLLRKPPGKAWLAPEACSKRKLGKVAGIDARVDAGGTVHLVWSEWNKIAEPQVIRHRAIQNGVWGPEEVLPPVHDVCMRRPLLYESGGRMHVLATGKAPAERYPLDRQISHKVPHIVLVQAGQYLYSATRKGWAGPQRIQLVDKKSSYEASKRMSVSPPGTGFLGALWTGNGLLLLKPDRAGRLQSDGTVDSIAGCLWDTYSGSRPAVCPAPDGRPYWLWSDRGHVILARRGDDGAAEGVCLRVNTESDEEATALRLYVGQTHFSAAWIDDPDRSPRQMWFCYKKIPSGPWVPTERLYWQLRAGVGVGWGLLDKRVRLRAERFYRAVDIPNAVKWYLWLLARGRYDVPILDRLRFLDAVGVHEVKKQLASYVIDCPQVVSSREAGDLRRLMKQLKFDPDPDKAKRYLKLPEQDSTTVRKLLKAWEYPPFVVPIAGGKEVVIRPKRWRIQRFIERFRGLCYPRLPDGPLERKLRQEMQDSRNAPDGGKRMFNVFKVLCRANVPSQPEELIVWTKIFGFSGGGGGGSIRLVSLADFEVRPASTTRPAQPGRH